MNCRPRVELIYRALLSECSVLNTCCCDCGLVLSVSLRSIMHDCFEQLRCHCVCAGVRLPCKPRISNRWLYTARHSEPLSQRGLVQYIKSLDWKSVKAFVVDSKATRAKMHSIRVRMQTRQSHLGYRRTFRSERGETERKNQHQFNSRARAHFIKFQPATHMHHDSAHCANRSKAVNRVGRWSTSEIRIFRRRY